MSEYIHQQLNEQLRDALLALYLTYALPEDSSLPPKHNIRSPDDIYAYWLLDVQVSQAVPTTRVASAIASLQHYINAISSGLEPGYETLGMSSVQHRLWRESLHAYSVWRTGQQMRHFPAHYLDPTLRSQKTESFQKLENDLNQCRLHTDSVRPAIQRYLTDFEEIATLTTLSGYIDGAPNNFANSTYYFIAKSNIDSTYFWRSLDMSMRTESFVTDSSRLYKQATPQPGAWTEWKKIPLPASEFIPGHSIRPVCFNNRLLIIWAECVSPSATHNNSTYTWAEPEESEKSYKLRLRDYLRSRFVQFRLYFSYMKYDGSWSGPQVCSDEYCVMKELNKLDKDAVKAATETIAVLDSTTQPPSLFVGLNAHAPSSSNKGSKYTGSDFFQAVRIHHDFSVKRLISRGTLVDLAFNAENEKLAKRYLALYIHNNKNSFNFHAPASETIPVNDAVNSTPSSETSNWNFENKQAFIRNLRPGMDIIYNATSCVLEVTSTLDTPFPEHQSIAFKGRNNDSELTLDLCLQRPTSVGNGKAELVTGSLLSLNSSSSRPCNWISIGITCLKTRSTYSSLIYDSDSATDTGVHPIDLKPVDRGWGVSLSGKFIEYEFFNFIFENSNTDYRITVHFHVVNDDPAAQRPQWVFENASATLYARLYKPVVIIPRNDIQAHPSNIHRANSYIVGEPKTSRRELNGTELSLAPDIPFSAHIQLDPNTLRPLEEQTQRRTDRPQPITIIHGVLIYDTDIRHNDRVIRGYALKSSDLTLPAKNAATFTPISPRITRRHDSSDGPVEFIDFSGSTINYSDNPAQQILRSPIRMNTGVSRLLIDAANISLDHLFSVTAGQWREPALVENAASSALDFHGAYGIYFWELFLYLPWLVASRLNMERRYSEAESWLNYIFDPQSNNTDLLQPKVHWKVPALIDDKRDLSYAQNQQDDPNLVALSAPVYFRQALYMLYLDIQFNRGDAAYRQANADSLVEAKLWYLRIKNLLGARPNITRSDPWQPVTLHELGASTSIEFRRLEKHLGQNHAPWDHLHRSPATDIQTVLARDSHALYLPLNPDLVARWDKLQSRLHNLRQHLNINGKPLQHAAFAPPISPYTLMSGYARNPRAGHTSVHESQQSDIGHYRFKVVYAHAMTRVENVIQLGNTLLLLFERKEQAQYLQQQQLHAWDLANIAVEQQKQSMVVDESNHRTLLAGRQVVEGRLNYYEKQLKEGISSPEALASQQYLEAAKWDIAAASAQASAGLAMLLPNIFGTSNGGMRLEGAFHAIQAGAQGAANEKRSSAQHLDRTELFNRRAQEWAQALDQCRLEITQLDSQLQAHAQHTAALSLQLRHSETAMEQARLTYEMLNKRFSSAELYQWLNSQLATFYYQAYDAAHSLCLTAQACWQFERADWNNAFITSSSWNNQSKGMTAGESLKLDLQRMDAAYLQRNQRELEITKTVSLRLLHGKDDSTSLNKNWTELKLQMVTDGTVDFALTKALFDADYPGHYLRRIKNVSVSLPATLGPYEDIRATLTQLQNQTQLSESPDDTRNNLRIREQVALSTGINDSGLFTLTFDTDDRYLPFEFTGAVSNWRLAFPNPTAQHAMLDSLSDIIIHVRYTARSAGGLG